MKVVGVRLKKADKIHLFDPSGVGLDARDKVVVKTRKGLEVGEVVFVRELLKADALGKVIRKASFGDEQKAKELDGRGKECLIKAQEEAAKDGLQIKILRAYFTLDGRRLIFDFSAKGRVNLKGLALRLSRRWGCLVEFHRVGSRDEVKIIGGVGLCGLPTCCSCWLYKFKPISLKMAVLQGLAPNPERLSGPCGKLVCCLSFELEYYIKAREETGATEDSSQDNDMGR